MLTVHRRGLLLQVSVSVGHNREHYKNDQTDPGTILDMNSGEPKEPCIKWGSGSPQRKGQFWIFRPIGNESLLKIITNNTINLFL